MKKQKPIILQIPKPCTETWAEMKPMGLGRFCAHCQKTVTDISQMSDGTIAQLFANNKEGICVRAFASQLNRPLQFPVQTPTRFYRIAVALGLTILTLAATDTYARPRPPLVEQNYFATTDDCTSKEKTGSDSLKISGIVLDEEGLPFAGLIVKLFKDDILKEATITDSNGKFIIDNIKKIDDYYLQINKLNEEPITIVYTKQRFEENKPVEVTYYLNDTRIRLGGMRQISTIISDNSKQEFYPPTKTFNSEDLKKMGY